MTFDNCYFVQFYIDENNTVVPVNEKKLVYTKSKKYDGLSFWCPEKGTKFGYYKFPSATHWGIFELKNNTPKLLIHAEFPPQHTKNNMYSLRKHYVVLRYINKYFKFRISDFRTIKEAEAHLNKEFIK